MILLLITLSIKQFITILIISVQKEIVNQIYEIYSKIFFSVENNKHYDFYRKKCIKIISKNYFIHFPVRTLFLLSE